jgi:cytochrome P450
VLDIIQSSWINIGLYLLYIGLESRYSGTSSGDISYDSIQNLPYLDQVIAETLRYHNLFALITRGTTRDYKVPGYDVIIDKGI